MIRRCQVMKANRIEEDLLERAEPLEWAEGVSQRMVVVVHPEDGALLLEVGEVTLPMES
jgi:hypothetical protein